MIKENVDKAAKAVVGGTCLLALASWPLLFALAVNGGDLRTERRDDVRILSSGFTNSTIVLADRDAVNIDVMEKLKIAEVHYTRSR